MWLASQLLVILISSPLLVGMFSAASTWKSNWQQLKKNWDLLTQNNLVFHSRLQNGFHCCGNQVHVHSRKKREREQCQAHISLSSGKQNLSQVLTWESNSNKFTSELRITGLKLILICQLGLVYCPHPTKSEVSWEVRKENGYETTINSACYINSAWMPDISTQKLHLIHLCLPSRCLALQNIDWWIDGWMSRIYPWGGL